MHASALKSASAMALALAAALAGQPFATGRFGLLHQSLQLPA